MNIILLNPRSSRGRKPVLPMSLLAVEALLKDRWSATIVDENLDNDALETIARLVRRNDEPAVLGVTVMPGPQLEAATPLCRALKDRFPDLTIVWGGYFPSQHWEACLRDRGVDFVVRHHGEQTFVELLERLASPDPRFDDIEGLAFRDGTTPVSNPDRSTPSPADFPMWNLDRVDMPRYLRRTFLGERTVGMHTSYGCPYFCNFCAVVNMVHGRWKAWPPERVERVAREYRERWNVDAIEFCDNNFFVDEARVADCAGRLAPLDLHWWGEGRVDTFLRFGDATWRAMAESGLKMVFLGAESGSAETLQRMDKGGSVSPEATLDLVKKMARWGIVPELSFVLGNPPEAEQDARQTMAFIRQVKRANPATEIILYLYTPVPLSGTLFDEARRAGFDFPETLDDWISGAWLEFAQRRSELTWLKPGLVKQIKNFERVLNATYPTTTMHHLGGWRRWLLQAAGSWRYHLRVNAFPLELQVLHRVLHYQRPETVGF